MESASMRRSDRVSLTVLLEASGIDSTGQEFKERSRTMLINRGGAVIVLNRELKPEQEIQIRRQTGSDSQKIVPARVVGEFGRQKDGFLYGIEILAACRVFGYRLPMKMKSNGRCVPRAGHANLIRFLKAKSRGNASAC